MSNNPSSIPTTETTATDTSLPDSIDLAHIEFNPITLRTWLYLEKTNSPLVLGAASKLDTENLLRTLYIITQPINEVGAAVRAGEEGFAQAVDAFAEHLSFDTLKELSPKLLAHFKAELSRKADRVLDEKRA